MGEVASHFSPGLRTLAAPASPRRSLARLTQPSEGAWLSPTNPPTLSPGARLAAQGPSPLWVATQMRDWSKGPHSHSPTAPPQGLWTRPARPTSRPWSSPALRTPPPSPCRSRRSCRRDRRSPPSSPPARLPAFAAQPPCPASRPVSGLPPTRPWHLHLQAAVWFGCRG